MEWGIIMLDGLDDSKRMPNVGSHALTFLMEHLGRCDYGAAGRRIPDVAGGSVRLGIFQPAPSQDILPCWLLALMSWTFSMALTPS